MFATALIMLGAATRARLEKYDQRISSFSREFPGMWWLVADADLKCRSEHFEVLRARLEREHNERRETGLPCDFDPARAWDAVFKAASSDAAFWHQQVEKRAMLYKTNTQSKGEVLDPGFGILNISASSLPSIGSSSSSSSDMSPAQLAALISAATSAAWKAGSGKVDWSSKGKGGKSGGSGKGGGQASQSGKGAWNYDKRGRGGRFLYSRKENTNYPLGTPICWGYARKKGECKVLNCTRAHICEDCRGSHPNCKPE